MTAMTSYPAPSAGLVEMFGSQWRHRHLLVQMIWRDVNGRYKGSIAGLAWSFFNPLLMLAIYTFVFGVIFKARWGVSQDAGQIHFAIVLFAGLIIHGLFAECVNRAPMLIVSNANFVRKVVFPLEILPSTALGSALFHAGISGLVLVLTMLCMGNPPHVAAVFVPLLTAPLALLALGLGWFLASLGVFLRDVTQITGNLTTMLLFLSPVFYPASALPERYRPLMQLNPLTFPIEQIRGALIWGRTPDWPHFGLYCLGCIAVAWLGFWWFQRTRKGFADVL